MYFLRWFRRSRRIIFLIFIVTTYFYFLFVEPDKAKRRVALNLKKEFLNKLRKELAIGVNKSQRQGCAGLEFDAWSPDTQSVNQHFPKVTYKGKDWVECYLDECATIKEILNTKKDVYCVYKDLYVDDKNMDMGVGKEVYGDETYKLVNSDHVEISCVSYSTYIPCRWFGYKTGLRHVNKPKKVSDDINVLILTFNSTSHNDFVRRMPESLVMLTDELKAIVFNKYNIIADGVSARFPLFTGLTELEFPDYKDELSSKHVKPKNLIYTASTLGYRTIYYDDTDTFQNDLNYSITQLADHNLRPVLKRLSHGLSGRHCFEDTPQHTLKFNLTHQMFHLKDNFFAFISINYDNNNTPEADAGLVALLRELKQSGRLNNTLVVVMGDRSSTARSVYQCKLEELRPFLAIHLPAKLIKEKPNALSNLKANAEILTTPFDVFRTLLDVLGIWQLGNRYRVKGGDITPVTRGMSLLKWIHASRSCVMAGVAPYWCTCSAWSPLAPHATRYSRIALELLDVINNVTNEERSKCHSLTMKKIHWVYRLESEKDLQFPLRRKRYMENQTSWYFQAKIETRPGNAVFEGAMRYFKDTDSYVINIGDVSRITDIGHFADCIIDRKSYLSKFCYCK